MRSRVCLLAGLVLAFGFAVPTLAAAATASVSLSAQTETPGAEGHAEEDDHGISDAEHSEEGEHGAAEEEHADEAHAAGPDLLTWIMGAVIVLGVVMVYMRLGKARQE